MSNGATSEQVNALGRELIDLRDEVKQLRKGLRRHEAEHVAGEARRRADRWRLAGLAVALVASVDGPVLAILFSRH